MGGQAIPAPPPPAVRERSDEVNFNPNGPGRFLFQIWDSVALFGPIDADDLYEKGRFVIQQSASWALYRQMNGIGEATTAEAKSLAADKAFMDRQLMRWHFDYEIELGLRNGFLTRAKNKKLQVGMCPPEHTPFVAMGGSDGARSLVTFEENRAALDLLRDKDESARMRPTRWGKANLKRSMELIGQSNPIFTWAVTGGVPLIIDGQTRYDILIGLGKDPNINPRGPVAPDQDGIWSIELPRTWPAWQVLTWRIELETSTTSKEQSKEARDAYIKILDERKFGQHEIARLTNTSQKTVSRVLLHLSQGDSNVTAPTQGYGKYTEATIQRWSEMHDDGWSYRGIAGETACSYVTIQRHVEAYRQAQLSGQTAEEVATQQQAAADTELLQKHVAPTDIPSTPEGQKKKAKQVRRIEEVAKILGANVKNATHIQNHRPAPDIAAALLTSEAKASEVLKLIDSLDPGFINRLR